MHLATCVRTCTLPGVTIVFKHIPGAAPQGPYWWGWQGGPYERIEHVKEYLKDKQLPLPTLTVINCVWWEVARALRDLGHDMPMLLSQQRLQEYTENLLSLLQSLQTDAVLKSTRLVLHTAAARNDQLRQDNMLTNSVAAQLNAAMRLVAHEVGVGLIDLAQQVAGLPATAVLRDYLHPQPWLNMHLFKQYLQCL